MATKKIDVPDKAPRTKRAPGVPVKGAPSTQEAKDLRSLINTLSEKNAPESSKDITAHAKQTLKIVGQSQKAESAAFKREATKALIDFRSFVEKTEKLTEARRSKLLSDIDSVTLDAKSATFMMLSIAKEQSKTIKMTAQKEALVEKLKAKQNATQLVEEAKAKAKAISDESKLKSKALSEEQMGKFKAMKEEMISRQKAVAEESRLKLIDEKAKIQSTKQDLKDKREQSKLKLVEEKEKIKAERVDLKAKYDSLRQELTDEKAKAKLELESEKIKIKEQRNEAAVQIKQMKSDLAARQQAKNDKAKADLKDKKAALAAKNSERIQKIRIMTEEHKARLKKVEEENKAEKLINKAKIKSQIDEIESKHKEKSDKANKNASELGNHIKEGFYDANPLIHAAIQIGTGIAGVIQKKMGDKKKQKELNRLNHRNTNSPNPTPNPNPAPPTPSPGGNPPPSNEGGGFFSSILAMIPSISGIFSSIVGFFKAIGGGLGKVGKLLGGAKAIPIIGTAISVVMAIFDFVEGFNNATALFGEKVEDSDYVKRIFSGFANVFGSIIGIFDTIAGWFGFDTDLEGKFRKAQVKLFNIMTGVLDTITGAVSSIFDSILSVVRTMAGNIAAILKYVPGGGTAAKALEAFSQAGKISPTPPSSTAAAIAGKQNTVNDLTDEVEAKKAKQGSVQIVSDSSTKVSSTTITTAPLSTRNPDYNSPMYLVTR